MTPSTEANEFLRVALAAIPRITEMIVAFLATAFGVEVRLA
jgi:hypothetical protein